MMRYEITAPDGRRFAITAPEGATQEEVLAYAQRQMGGGTPPAEDAGRGGGALPFLNRVIASGAGAPVDLANLVLKYAGLPVSERPFGGSASIESGLARLGRATNTPMVPGEDMVPETPEEYIGRGVGEAATMLIPGYGLARVAASSARPLLSRVGQTVAQAPVAAPIATLGGEMAAGAGAGAGRYIAETANPDTPYAGQVGELVGGFTPGLVALLAKYGPTGLLLRAAGRAQEVRADPTRAPGRLQSLTANPEAAARAAETPSIADLTPAQRTQEPRLLALERAVAQGDPALEATLRERAGAAQTTLLEEARALGGDPAQTRAFLETRRDRLNAALEARVTQAQTRADERIAALEPGSSAEDASRIVREEFDRVYNLARQQENDLWRSIPQDVKVDTASLFNRFDDIVASTPRTQQQDIPEYARRFLSPDAEGNRGLQNIESPAELQGFRSELLAIERRASDAGERNQARLARQLADATLDVMNAMPDVGGAYGAARDFSRQLNLTFREGPAGRLAETTSGVPSIDPELTLSRLIGGGGVQGGVAERSLMAATADSPAAQAAIQDYLMRDLRNRTVTAEGRLKPEAAESWMRRNEALLERYPQIRESLTAALQAQTRARSVEASQAAISQRLETPRATAIARFLEGNPNDAVTRILNAENPAEVATSLRRAASRDDSGAALAGLRGAFVDNILARARQPGPDGEVFRGSVVLEALQNPQQRAALEAVFSPEDLTRLRQIGTEFLALERARGALPGIGGVTAPASNKMIDSIARVGGAKFGSYINRVTGGGGNIQTPGIMSERFRGFARDLTEDRATKLLSRAVTDPELFATLMRDSRTRAQQDQTVRSLQGWLAGPAGRALFEEESDEPEQGMGAAQSIYGSVMNPAANLAATQNLINSPAMRNRIGAIFDVPAHANLFTAALNREAQLFHRANQASRGNFTGAGGFEQSLTNLVTQAVQNGRLNEASATRITGMLMSNEPQQVAAAVRFLENASSRR